MTLKLHFLIGHNNRTVKDDHFGVRELIEGPPKEMPLYTPNMSGLNLF